MSVSTPWVDRQELLASAESVEPLPQSIARLASLIADPDTELSKITEVVSLDISLTADLLRRVNSVSFAGLKQIASVTDATIRIGRSALLSLALASSVGNRMRGALPAYGLPAGELWGRSVAASIGAEVIRSRALTVVPAEAGTAALLHDFGKVVMARLFGNQVLDMLAIAAAHDGLDLLDAERSVFGFTHAEIGGIVAESWDLPVTIVDGIRDHHEAHTGLSPISAAVGLAVTVSVDVVDPRPSLEAVQARREQLRSQAPLFEVLALDQAAYAGIVETTRERFREVSERFS